MRKCVVKYSPVTGSWVRVAEMHDRRKGWCSCAFGDKIWVIGGEKIGKLVSELLWIENTTKEEKVVKTLLVFLEKMKTKLPTAYSDSETLKRAQIIFGLKHTTLILEVFH